MPAAGPTRPSASISPKIPDHGEDSDPILRDGPDLGITGVFDGMGGAGGTVYSTDDGSRSGAYIASRLARDVVEERLLALLVPERPLPGAATASDLHDAVETALRGRLEDLKAPASGLRSRLLRALPTTMAVGVLQRRQPDAADWICHVLWAGDSRVYAFTPSGMHQLSIDDLRDPGDAMVNLQHDSVISNAISADTDFTINHRRVALEAPFFIMSATDGCFGYLRSPMHFEEIVLRSLASATTEDEWSMALQAEVSAVTGDDAAMAAIAVGADLPTLRAAVRTTAGRGQRGLHRADGLAAARGRPRGAGAAGRPAAPGRRHRHALAALPERIRAVPAGGDRVGVGDRRRCPAAPGVEPREAHRHRHGRPTSRLRPRARAREKEPTR